MDQSPDSQIHKCNLCTETFSKEIYLQIHRKDVHDSARSGNILKRIVINIKQKEYKVDDDKSIEKEVEKTKVQKDKSGENFVDKDTKSESVLIKVLKSDGSYENDLYSNNKFINVKEIKIDPYEHIDEESILQQLNEKQQQLEKSDTDYGNTGYGVSGPGIQNQKGFCLKINIPKGNYWILRIGVMGRCRKVPKFDCKSQFSMSKIIRIFPIFFSLKNTNLENIFYY